MATSGAGGAPGLVGRDLAGYHIVELLGAGGMGEVYRAEQSEPRRTVALKVLRRSLLMSADGRARFQREGRAAAGLSHPGIAAVYEVGEAAGLPFIAMEYVQGEGLDAWLARPGLTLPQVVRVLEQLAEALADAHAKGVVHRDLKPANVVVLPGGGVKLLDFGLAKIVHEDDPDSGVRSQLITRPGGVLGTSAYMSPEQARGQALDRRTDVFSFGVMLFEALAGVPPFKGESGVEAVSGVLRDDPLPLLRERVGIDPELVRIVDKALRKDPAERYQHMDDLVVDLRAVRRQLESPLPAARPRRPWPWLLAGAAAGAAAAAVIAALGWDRRAPLPLASGLHVRPLTFDAGRDRTPAVSPAGDLVAFSSDRAGTFDVYLHQLQSGRVLRLSDGPGDELDPAFSPDGGSIAYGTSEGRIEVIPSLGGSSRVLAWGGREPAWSPDGRRVAFRSGGAIAVAEARGGGEQRLTPAGSVPAVGRPAWSPDGAWLVFPSVQDGRPFLARVPASGGPVVAMSEEPLGIGPPAWSSDGRWLVAADAADDLAPELWAVPVHPSGRIDGNPVRLLAGLDSYGAPSLSRDRRTLAVEVRQVQAWIGRLPLAGPAEAAPVHVRGRLRDVRAAHAGDLLALVVEGSAGGALATAAVEGGVTRPLDTPGVALHPDWSPDDRSLAFVSAGDDGHRIAVMPSGGGPAQLRSPAGSFAAHPAWSPDGGRLAYSVLSGADGAVRMVDAAGGGERTLLQAQRRPGRLAWSPDGRWIAVALENDPGDWAVSVLPSSGGLARQLVARARAPLWLADGRIVFARETRPGAFDLWSVRVNPDATVQPGSEQQLTALPAGHSVDAARGASTEGRHLFFRVLAATAEDVWLGQAR